MLKLKTYTESQVLHHTPKWVVLRTIRWFLRQPISTSYPFDGSGSVLQFCMILLTILNQFLYAACWVNFHGAEIFNPIYFGSLLSEFLIESIAEVVRWIG